MVCVCIVISRVCGTYVDFGEDGRRRGQFESGNGDSDGRGGCHGAGYARKLAQNGLYTMATSSTQKLIQAVIEETARLTEAHMCRVREP